MTKGNQLESKPPNLRSGLIGCRWNRSRWLRVGRTWWQTRLLRDLRRRRRLLFLTGYSIWIVVLRKIPGGEPGIFIQRQIYTLEMVNSLFAVHTTRLLSIPDCPQEATAMAINCGVKKFKATFSIWLEWSVGLIDCSKQSLPPFQEVDIGGERLFEAWERNFGSCVRRAKPCTD